MANDIKWSIDPSHSDIGFKIRHLMISHIKGAFKVFDASIYTTDKDSNIGVVVLSNTVNRVDDIGLKILEYLENAASTASID